MNKNKILEETDNIKINKKNLLREWTYRHGMSRTRFYVTYRDIKSRCENKNSCSYKYAGKKGVKCEWKTFLDFKKDMFASYIKHISKFSTRDTTIGRIDNNGNYCKKNCRWESQYQQSRNKSSLRMITFNGKKQCCVDWEKELNFNRNTIYNRLNIFGWSLKKTMTTPVKCKKHYINIKKK